MKPKNKRDCIVFEKQEARPLQMDRATLKTYMVRAGATNRVVADKYRISWKQKTYTARSHSAELCSADAR